MVRKPRDYDAELQTLMQRARKLKGQKVMQLGELVQMAGADALPIEALLEAVELFGKQPEAVTRWTVRGQALFHNGGKRKGKGPGAVPEPASHSKAASAPVRAAE